MTNYAYNSGVWTCLLNREISRQTLPWQFCNFTPEIIINAEVSRKHERVICQSRYQDNSGDKF